MHSTAPLDSELSCGRLHLPVAARCNIQCKYCDRNYDCANQSRPGVASELLTPTQALAYLDAVLAAKDDITAVGVAGPGDALADPEKTLETLRLVAQTHPQYTRFISTNGLALAEHAQALTEAGVSRVYVAVNAVDPAIAARVYYFVRAGKRNLFGQEGAALLIESQRQGIAACKALGLEVIAVCTVIPDINDAHVADIAAWLAALGVDGLELTAFHPAQASPLGAHPPATKAMMLAAREAAAPHLPLMECCTHCRADAIGLLGEEKATTVLNKIKAMAANESPWAMPDAQRPLVAVATSNGETVDTHLGHARRLLIYQNDQGLVTLQGHRQAPPKGGGDDRWKALADLLADCKILIVASAGDTPQRVLGEHGLSVRVVPEDTDVAAAVLASFGVKNKKGKQSK
ncbi:radical SAM protein [Megalodesulfovibrio gigas]|uniref:FeMo cofactor biosynthesis protein NifB n=1 Tax=Megalodesulfovibrio gigas (strain ATCC 19364 / DSM 1382 / NCIMB 9332 / VKM B-1759) TaxID=1121448 RepID=T2GA32_MEGG1|nr:radical SAM protein [Megalodesulfovibrio gigas]AGW13128.1 putative nitrogenase cofactor biosynthesis protein NifB [Megalodesulfovibrio gigas DSM 1382 = ATCC 19364]